jgi:hypothetical protein
MTEKVCQIAKIFGHKGLILQRRKTMKPLKEMTSRELFCLLTGDGDAMQQAMLKELILAYKAKYPEKVGHFGEMDLAAIVAEMTETE